VTITRNTLSGQNAQFLVLNIAYVYQSLGFERSRLQDWLLVIFECRITNLFKNFKQQNCSTYYQTEPSYLHA